jgi:1,4-alpha-glucan branching enzyme
MLPLDITTISTLELTRTISLVLFLLVGVTIFLLRWETTIETAILRSALENLPSTTLPLELMPDETASDSCRMPAVLEPNAEGVPERVKRDSDDLKRRGRLRGDLSPRNNRGTQAFRHAKDSGLTALVPAPQTRKQNERLTGTVQPGSCGVGNPISLPSARELVASFRFGGASSKTESRLPGYTPKLGYNGIDLFSPEMDYSVPPAAPDFQQYFDKANQLLGNRGLPPLKETELDCQTKQLMALVDLFHVYGIAVIFDVVYKHAGGDFGDEGLYFYDREPQGDNNRSLFFTDKGWAGGLVFAYWKQEVRQFLIDNAQFFFDEYHVDGFRFDEVMVIDRFGGWGFLQDITDGLRYRKPEAVLIAEYWADQPSVLRPRGQGGAGFDSVVASGLRQAIRKAVSQAAGGADATVNLDPVAATLNPPFGEAWRAVQHLENQDVVRIDNTSDRQPRVAALADSTNARSWYARSRSRVANGLLLTAPGIPMFFMGQEFMEDKYWSDSPNYFADSLIWWDGLDSDRAMRDHLRFVSELAQVRHTNAALCGDRINVYHVHNDNRVLAFHRWLEGTGDDVVVVVSLREQTWWSYELGFPRGGEWTEIFNGDVYDNWVNPVAAGNGGKISAGGPPMHGFQTSASIVIPANSILVFAAR